MELNRDFTRSRHKCSIILKVYRLIILSLSLQKEIDLNKIGKMKTKLFSVLLLAFLVWSCAATKENDCSVKITGKIKNPIEQGEIILEKFEVGEVIPISTVKADADGNFEISTDLSEAGFYRINVYGQQMETIILDKDDLKVVADGQGGSEITVTGSKDARYMSELNTYMTGMGVRVQDFNKRFLAAQRAGNQPLMQDLGDEGMDLEDEKNDNLKRMAWTFENSLVSLLITDFIQDKSEHISFLDSLSVKLQEEIPNSSHVAMFVSNLDMFRPSVALGDIAPEITMDMPEGGSMNLSDLRGKYVLLDFWAAWCRPCRAENPNVVNMYNKYKSKGFEVFSVSLDRTKNAWVAAIEKDGLIWPSHVSDLKYFQSEAAMNYKVNAIPFALLLDPEGRVIGKNLRGRQLQAKLASIFGE